MKGVSIFFFGWKLEFEEKNGYGELRSNIDGFFKNCIFVWVW